MQVQSSNDVSVTLDSLITATLFTKEYVLEGLNTWFLEGYEKNDSVFSVGRLEEGEGMQDDDDDSADERDCLVT